jgi:hypothetical protein
VEGEQGGDGPVWRQGAPCPLQPLPLHVFTRPPSPWSRMKPRWLLRCCTPVAHASGKTQEQTVHIHYFTLLSFFLKCLTSVHMTLSFRCLTSALTTTHHRTRTTPGPHHTRLILLGALRRWGHEQQYKLPRLHSIALPPSARLSRSSLDSIESGRSALSNMRLVAVVRLLQLARAGRRGRVHHVARQPLGR